MLDHSGIRVSDLARSRAFYMAALAPLGYAVALEYPGDAVGFGVPDGFGKSLDPGGDFWIGIGAPMKPRPHFAFSAASPAVVDAFHSAALAAGATDNGPPGPRGYHPGYYAAFVLDPDGYNIEAVCHDAPA
jgi:catechol 2,3-dioxygenase-like lactoylglutathione lyase family enzyme